MELTTERQTDRKLRFSTGQKSILNQIFAFQKEEDRNCTNPFFVNWFTNINLGDLRIKEDDYNITINSLGTSHAIGEFGKFLLNEKLLIATNFTEHSDKEGLFYANFICRKS